MSTPTERREVEAVVQGDWTHCGGCQTRVALGVAPVRLGARVKCFRCGAWVAMVITPAEA